LALTDRALALDPDNRDALALIDAIGRGRVRRRTIALGLAVVAAGAACWGALAMWPVSSEKDEVADGATAAAAAVGAASRAPGRSGGAATAEPVRAGVVLPGSSAGASGARAASSAPDEAGAVPPGPSAGSSAALSARSSAAPSAPDLGSSAAASPPHAREHAVAGASDPQRGTRPRGAIDDDSATRARARTARNRDGDGDRDRRPIPVDRDAPSSVASTQSGPASTQSGPASTRPDPASAAAPSSVSAAPAAAPAARAPVPAASTSPADAIITLEMDAWCRVTVEGKPVGQARPRLELRLSPGAHTIACAQDIRGRRWSERITARSGERRVVRGRVLPPPVAVTVALRHGDAVRIDRKRVVDGGASIQLPVGRYRIELLRDGAPIGFGFADLRGPPCTLVDEPAIACR
ncbi:MAG TPA: hypothetical protein VK698_01105, partial [Kofleriaceae bacterium]|nr:hypothetical protein [Kofleriaceae bacterium]